MSKGDCINLRGGWLRYLRKVHLYPNRRHQVEPTKLVHHRQMAAVVKTMNSNQITTSVMRYLPSMSLPVHFVHWIKIIMRLT